jgi:uncharacterized membrane protein SirB2
VTLFDGLKIIHVSCAVLSIGGFSLRGYWMLSGNALLDKRIAKTLPHIIDTLLLASAIGMLFIWQTSPFEFTWLGAKVLALLAYIGLGMVALRFGRTRQVRILAWTSALVVAAYIVSVALNKSALGFFA